MDSRPKAFSRIVQLSAIDLKDELDEVSVFYFIKKKSQNIDKSN